MIRRVHSSFIVQNEPFDDCDAAVFANGSETLMYAISGDTNFPKPWSR